MAWTVMLASRAIRLRTVMAVVALLWLVAAAPIPTQGGEVVTLTLMSDFHHDPLRGTGGSYNRCADDTVLVKPGCESSSQLISSAISDAVGEGSSYVFFAGSMLRLDAEYMTEQQTNESLWEVTEMLSRFQYDEAAGAKPAKSVVTALGRTDFVPRNTFSTSYDAPTTTDVLENVTQRLMHFHLLSYAEKETASWCGYYYRDLDDLPVRVVVLNTVLWASDLRPGLQRSELDPCSQVRFLNSVLSTLQGRRAIILGHVPPTYSVPGVLEPPIARVSPSMSLWRDDFRNAYLVQVRAFRSQIIAQLFGSRHMFGFVAAEDTPPLYLIPSLTAVSAINPSYLIAHLDRESLELVSLRQRGVDKTGSWAEVNRLEDIIEAPLEDIGPFMQQHMSDLVNVERRWRALATMQVGGVFLTQRAACGESCRRMIVCASAHFDVEAINRCVAVADSSVRNGDIIAWTFAAVFSISVLTAVALSYYFFRVIFEPPDAVKRARSHAVRHVLVVVED